MSNDVLAYVESPYGLGHLVRILEIAKRIHSLGIRINIVSSTLVENGRHIDGIDIHKISPPYSIEGDLDPDNLSADIRRDFTAGQAEILRHRQLLEIVQKIDPALLVVEGCPLLRQKMIGSIHNLRKARPSLVIVASVRDRIGYEEIKRTSNGVLQIGTITRNEPGYQEIYRSLDEDFDAILVHSDPAIMPFDLALDNALARKTFYTGYVVGDVPAASSMPEEQKHVLVSVGDGTRGEKFLFHALRAREFCSDLKSARWHFIVGLRSADVISALINDARTRGLSVEYRERNIICEDSAVIFSTHCDDFLQRLADARVAVIGGGYNTVIESLKMRARFAAIAMFSRDGGNIKFQAEQISRLRVMQDRGLLDMLDTGELQDPRDLADMLETLATHRRTRFNISFNGAAESAALIAQWCQQRNVSPAPLL